MMNDQKKKRQDLCKCHKNPTCMQQKKLFNDITGDVLYKTY